MKSMLKSKKLLTFNSKNWDRKESKRMNSRKNKSYQVNTLTVAIMTGEKLSLEQVIIMKEVTVFLQKDQELI